MLTIQEVKDKKVWDDFLDDPKIIFYPFFQSWNWGEVSKRLGFKIWRLGVWENKKLVGMCQVVLVKAKRGIYLHLRHGPVLNPFDETVCDVLINHIKQLARGHNASFIRLNPVVEKQHVSRSFTKSRGMKNSPLDNMDAEVCWVLDITKSENEIIADMRKSHRYLIKKALGDKSLTVLKTTDTKDMERFLPLYATLSKRKHFVPHRGLTEEFEVFKNDNQSVLILILQNKVVLGGGLFDFVGNMAIYRHSASNARFKQTPIMYLLLWEAIKEAKRRGMTTFNFWGIAITDSKYHPWFGLSQFKKGFGGEVKEFLHAQDLPLNVWYLKTYLIEYLSKIIRRH